ncbi:MAG: aminotransferase class I/II-fold pyridoxal phosphate-dependent enzyme [Clostridia bacterium]|nr:aminotransferase class I/II-fold pyridoxal phosphate-dependent enzyme [Clostridia bacterium]
MLYFDSDYLEGADARVLRALVETNGEQTAGYGEDEHCKKASALIREMAMAPEAAVHFVTGGTQANLTVAAAALKPWEGVLSADTGHINVHETGAIEATGHKVLALPGSEGKLSAEQVTEAALAHREDGPREHMVKPGLVYISHPSELGTLYTRLELEALSAACRKYGLWLYLDGARLGYGLAAEPSVDLPLLARCCDAFTIGGTKAGLLFGEAIVLTAKELQDCFRYAMKQRGGMLAKGRLLGVQFEALLRDGYYVEACSRANGYAQRIKEAWKARGFSLLCDTVANQVFPVLPTEIIARLRDKYSFAHWQQVDKGHAAVRFCASCTTREEDVQALISDIEAL